MSNMKNAIYETYARGLADGMPLLNGEVKKEHLPLILPGRISQVPAPEPSKVENALHIPEGMFTIRFILFE